MDALSNVALNNLSPRSQIMDRNVIRLLEELALASAQRGYPVKPYTQKALATFAFAPISKKEDVIKNLETTIRIVAAGVQIERITPPTDYTERRLVEKALEFYGFELKDEDFWDRLGKDELIEIYNTDNIQIFRTFNFFVTSSYSLLDLLMNEWYNLWERPNGTLEKMYKLAEGLFSGARKGITPCGVPEHVISEIFNAEDEEVFTSRSSLCQFGIICPVYNKTDGKIGGLLISAQVIPVALGEEAKSISFI